jgi:hypothetical protein
MRTPLITDRAPVGVYSPSWFQAALARPFVQTCAAAFSPLAALWKHPNLPTFLALRFSLLYVQTIKVSSDTAYFHEKFVKTINWTSKLRGMFSAQY